MTRHFDVIVLGRSLGALAAAALLARRDLRVLLLGQGERPAEYQVDGRTLRRRSFTFLGASSPAFRRLLHELAQTPRFRRRTLSLDPMFALLAPGTHVEVPPDPEAFAAELDREFPEIRQLVDELYATLTQANVALDTLFERGASWPPSSLWERWSARRAMASLPLLGREPTRDLLTKFPQGHLVRELVTVPARFAGDLAETTDDSASLILARLHGAWTRGVSALEGGERELEDFLTERVIAHGGECRLDGRARALAFDRERLVGVLEDGEEQPVGTSWLVTDQTGEQLADLAAGHGLSALARRSWPRVSVAEGRFIVSARLKPGALNAMLPTESFLLPTRDTRTEVRRPTVHLQRFDRAVDAGSGPSEEPLLVAEMLLPVRGPLTLLEAREAVLSTLREHLPFFDENLLLLDSPHDGLPVWDYSTGARRELERLHLGRGGAERMRSRWSVEPTSLRGLAGEPVRGPIRGTFLVGTSVLPALGQEGQLLAALAAVHLITRRDHGRQRMRRQLWTKLETG